MEQEAFSWLGSLGADRTVTLVLAWCILRFVVHLLRVTRQLFGFCHGFIACLGVDCCPLVWSGPGGDNWSGQLEQQLCSDMSQPPAGPPVRVFSWQSRGTKAAGRHSQGLLQASAYIVLAYIPLATTSHVAKRKSEREDYISYRAKGIDTGG